MTRKNMAMPLAQRHDSAPVSRFVHNGHGHDMLMPLLGVACIECELPARYLNVTQGLVFHAHRGAPCRTSAGAFHGQ